MQKRTPITFLLTVLAVFSSLSSLPAQTGNLMEMFTSPVMQEADKIRGRIMYRSLWEGTGTSSMIFALVTHSPDFQEALGVSAEQVEQLKAATFTIAANPDFAAATAEIEKLTSPNDPYFMKASPETTKAYLAATEKMTKAMTLLMPQEMDKLITPEQKQRMLEIQIAAMGVFPIPTPEMFEALDLTDEQREQLEVIKKEMEVDFDRICDELTESQHAAMGAVYAQMQQDGVKVANFGELDAKINEAIKKLETKSGKDYRMTAEEKVKSAQDFTKTLKFKMFDVMTDAQMKKMWDLINKPPKYMDKILPKLKKSYEERSKTPGWQPGSNAWQPGDPIPADYIEHRKAKFPKKK